MENKPEKAASPLVFAVNQQRFELSTVDPSTTLLHFLRHHTPFKSAKLGCGEGGCGACVVLLSKYDPVLDKVEDFTVSSCLTLLCSIHGCSVTTSEGLGNSKDGFHSIHQRFAGFHASQCGFCTPGMCVSLFSALVDAEKTNRPETSPGFSKLTVSEAEKAISGNLCRCTGYRPIADACKSFAADVDMEDLGLNSFWRKGCGEDVKLSKLPPYSQSNGLLSFPEFLKKELRPIPFVDSKGRSWLNPVSVEDLNRLLESNETSNTSKIKFVVGNTEVGYYKEFEHVERYINLKHIPELSVIRRDSTGIDIGATVTIAKAIEALKNNNHEPSSVGELVFSKIADHMEKIASGFVRNTASIGGNLMMAQRRQFPSDIATILLAAGSMISILTGSNEEVIMLDEFLKRPPLGPKCVLLSVKIPNWDSVRDIYPNDTTVLFNTFRPSPRPLGNALPYLNAAFLAVISPCKSSNGILLNSCHLSFGAYGTKHAIRARKVEEFLAGKVMDYNVIFEAVSLIAATIVPEKGTSSPSYRTSLAVGFLFEFLSSLVDGNVTIKSDCLNGCKNTFTTLPDRFTSNHDLFGYKNTATLLSSGKQTLELNSEYHPVGDTVTKSGAAIQASGEAIYVDDIPSPTNCLYGAFIYSRKPLARVNGLTFSPEYQPKGVIAVISTKDIPVGGHNVGARTMFGDEVLFADKLTESVGQPLAFVVADTQKHADTAADFAVVDYDIDDLEAPILSVESALERSSFFEVPAFLYPEQVGDMSKGMTEADHHIKAAQIKLGSQYYFYMETQTALAIPDEDNCMVVYSSSQWPANAHSVIAKCLGVPAHNIRVITRRVGGGFGGKAIKSMAVATACALAAHKLRRPVRIYLNRKTDMIMMGGRHPMKITYNVGFKSNGKITALDLEILVDAGMSCDISPVMPHNIVNALKKYDWGALSFDIKVCKTNHTSKSAMRAPGEVQGSFIAEAVIEHVASTLCMDVDTIRKVNLHTFDSLSRFFKDVGEPQEYTLPSIWDRLATSSNLKQRTEMLNEFNSCNRWKKRGLSRIPITHEVLLRPTPGKVSILTDASVVVEVGGIELGQGLWTKVRQMVAYALSSIECDGTGNLLEKVRVVQSDTVSLIQGGCTAGSTTSESSCEAVRLCCNILVERLQPLKKRLEEKTGSVKWDVLISQANLESVNLSVNSMYIPDFVSMRYLNYGVAVSEVEINLLTGETSVLRSDIIYDCGQSLNPAVDLGQVEGAFVQGIGFFMSEEYLTNSDGLMINASTWTYKIPTIDTIPKQFNVQILNSGHHKKRVLSSKASGEPPLLLAASVHCATQAAIKEARKQIRRWRGQDESDHAFQLEVPATLPVVKEACGLDCVESYLKWINESEVDALRADQNTARQ
ncbi:indole-3-acetaldehyde oxidase-like isoform X1 [Cucurbita pepo subsp. pepo]|uniref:indole-3-acetaldehyde oxidase-like isoform X1 n=1 Tax=Cucurbita pepo subsp. pepo TaxID=3664 RepID=UPI000C9D77CA|nr:indole-3-acetaldehyde oxidase-like isoform X1 [Cucurbita pepo subsp. pepo]XP_023533500.1 indole-3-acetaldehyde oxidase-like isoform X1 [Cucurbita pepo subsp. pepo]